jgi:membrane protease YdiL (CAAX protease family)
LPAVPDPGRDTSPARPIPLGAAFLTWLVGWALGMILVAATVLAALGVEGDDYSIGELALATTAAWLVLLAALIFTSRRYGSGGHGGDFADHYAVAWKPVDLIGLPIGVATQLLLVPLVYLPLRELWPTTFSDDEIEQRAQELADKAGGATTVLLFVVVAVGAPLVEELVYRGLLQGAVSRVVGAWVGLLLASAWFALVHPSPVEWPGLFVAGLTFGCWLTLTGRIGGAVMTHLAFNVTGLFMALR